MYKQDEIEKKTKTKPKMWNMGRKKYITVIPSKKKLQVLKFPFWKVFASIFTTSVGIAGI